MPLIDPTALIFDNESRFAESSHLPLAITFTVSKSLLASAATNRPFGGYFDDQSIKWLKGYSAGFIGGHFEVAAITNVGAFEFPSSFLLVRNDSADGKVVEKYIGKVSTVRVGVAAVHLPELPQAVGVSDFRFRDEQKVDGVAYINYVVTNQIWLPRSDAGLQTVFEKRKKTWGMAPRQESKTPSPFWIRIVMLTIAVAPIIFWVARRIISRKTPQT